MWVTVAYAYQNQDLEMMKLCLSNNDIEYFIPDENVHSMYHNFVMSQGAKIQVRKADALIAKVILQGEGLLKEEDILTSTAGIDFIDTYTQWMPICSSLHPFIRLIILVLIFIFIPLGIWVLNS